MRQFDTPDNNIVVGITYLQNTAVTKVILIPEARSLALSNVSRHPLYLFVVARLSLMR